MGYALPNESKDFLTENMKLLKPINKYLECIKDISQIQYPMNLWIHSLLLK